MFFLYGFASQNLNLFQSFGFEKVSILIGFLLFQFVFAPVDKLTSFLMNCLTRRFEFQADEVSKELGYKEELKSGLIKVHTKNLSKFLNNN